MELWYKWIIVARRSVKSLLSSFACSLFSWFLFRFRNIFKKQCIILIHHLETDAPLTPTLSRIIFWLMLLPPTSSKCVESHHYVTCCFHSPGDESARKLHYPIHIIDTLKFSGIIWSIMWTHPGVSQLAHNPTSFRSSLTKKVHK